MIHVSTAEKNFAENTFFVSTFLDKYMSTFLDKYKVINENLTKSSMKIC